MAINFVQIHKVLWYLWITTQRSGGRASNRRRQRGSNKSGFPRTWQILLQKRTHF